MNDPISLTQFPTQACGLGISSVEELIERAVEYVSYQNYPEINPASSLHETFEAFYREALNTKHDPY